MKNSNQEENDFSFPSKKHRIRNYKDFKSFFKSSNVINASFGWVRIKKNNLGYLRIAVSVSKKASKRSTVRNRLKRICNELLRLKKNDLKSLDVWVFINAYVPNLREELEKAISEAYST